jgi:reactive intermediate/imine deaminase
MNPFPSGDADRHQIWEMLIQRDIAAFLAGDWSIVEQDFAADQFVGHSGPANPDHWRIAYPTLESYRDEWLSQAKAFSTVKLRGISTVDFLYRASVLRDIEITQDCAVAHKKFDGRAVTESGEPIVLNWQSVYWLRRFPPGWKITGFLGYLPNPMPGSTGGIKTTSIVLPTGASQHVTAGPYSPALRISADSLIAISGQGPIDEAGQVVGTTIQEQTELTLTNCRRQLESAGASFRDVFKVVVYLRDMQEWAAFNEVYRKHFQPPYPVRTAIQVVLWGDMKVEIDMLAIAR